MEDNGILQLTIGLDLKASQKERILRFIKNKGSINRIQAYEYLGIFELSARICDLIKDGYEFDKITKRGRSRLGYEFNYVVYSLKE